MKTATSILYYKTSLSQVLETTTPCGQAIHMAELRAVVIEVNISTWSTVSITKHWSKKKDTHIGIASDPLLASNDTKLWPVSG